MMMKIDAMESRRGRGLLLFLLLLASLFSPPAWTSGRAAGSAGDAALIPACGGPFDLCGYVDRSNGREVIPRRFERAMPFSEGRAAVRIEGLFGYIGRAGKIVIPPRFDLAGPFHNGLAEVVVDKQAGVIAESGNFVLPPRFGRAIPLTENVVIAQRGSYSSSELPEAARLELLHQMIPARKAPAGLYHLTKGWLTTDTFEFSAFDAANGKRVWARRLASKRELFGLMRDEGTWQIEPAFTLVQQLQENRAIVSTESGKGSARHRLSGAVDPEGKVVVPVRYDWLSRWYRSYATVRLNGREGFLKQDGRLLGEMLYEDVERDRQGWPARALTNGKWSDISSKGKPAEPPSDIPLRQKTEQPSVVRKATECDGGVSIVEKGGFWGLAGPDGRLLVEPRFEAISCFRQGVTWVPDRAGRSWCPIGPDGQKRRKPACRPTYYPVTVSHYYPERLDPDPFESNVLWIQAFLKHAHHPEVTPPRLMGDGIMAKGSIAATCRTILRCD